MDTEDAILTLMEEYPELIIECTCGACPEQFDVFTRKDKRQIGYIRVRHGLMAARYPDCDGEAVYVNGNICGDGTLTRDERLPLMTKAIESILTADKTTI